MTVESNLAFESARHLTGQTTDHSTARVIDALRESFDVEFSIWDGENGQLLWRSAEQSRGDEGLQSELARAASTRHYAQFIGDADCVLLLALPLSLGSERQWVAVAAFVTQRIAVDDAVTGAAQLLGLRPATARDWIERQPVWQPEMLTRLGNAVIAKLNAESRVERLSAEIEQVSDNLASTYEELSLLYSITQKLRISSSDEQLGQLALEWLIECLPAEGVAIYFLPVEQQGATTYKARTKATLITSGEFPIDAARFHVLIETLAPSRHGGPLVANAKVTSEPAWPFPEIRELILTPLAEGDNVFGWIAAANHETDGEFGTVEASLLSSIGAILGIHSGNRDLYRQQSEFLASVVRALTSAIDAKDPYTCGHSDRVARIAVRLAKQLGCDTETVGVLYMAGLLHDIGKIGINDGVLSKPGRLTEAEYEHIKLHPQLGQKILADLKQLAEVLPVVFHHHEQWDGKGYPHGLAGEQIPLSARIVAVADAFDALTSNRPYRDGMPFEKAENVLRSGAGTQWDARVVDAFFAARDDMRNIVRRERENLTLDVRQWV